MVPCIFAIDTNWELYVLGEFERNVAGGTRQTQNGPDVTTAGTPTADDRTEHRNEAASRPHHCAALRESE